MCVGVVCESVIVYSVGHSEQCQSIHTHTINSERII